MDRKRRNIPWLTWLGAIVLFLSWASETYFQAERQSELNYLNNAQLLISVEEGHLTEWLGLLLVEQAKDSPNQDVVRAAALKAAKHHLNILSWAIARVTDPNEHKELLKEKDRLQKILDIAYKHGDTEQLLAILNALNQASDTRGPVLIAAFSSRYNEARNAEAFWRRAFLLMYAFGSLMVGIGVFRAWKHGTDGSEIAASPNKPIQRTAKGRR